MTTELRYSLALVEDRLWVARNSIGSNRYDFDFDRFFACRHPLQRESTVRAVCRMGATGEYEARYKYLLAERIEMIHTPAEYERTSQLPAWYPLIEDLTPRSMWFEHLPTLQQITDSFRWPVFVKGERQTSKHRRSLCILEGPEDFENAMRSWEDDPILRWQHVVCREYVDLRLVGEQSRLTLPRAFEFRSFWWHDQCVGIGPYWIDQHYQLTQHERAAAIGVGVEAARRLGVTFLVVDLAQTAAGRWVVIECNDGQDAGYAGVAPMLMWRRIIDLLE